MQFRPKGRKIRKLKQFEKLKVAFSQANECENCELSLQFGYDNILR